MKDSGKIIGALLLGVAVGAVIGIIFAPEKGSETRKKLMAGAKDLAEDLKENFTDTVNNILNREDATEGIAEGKLVEFKENLKEKAEQHSHL